MSNGKKAVKRIPRCPPPPPDFVEDQGRAGNQADDDPIAELSMKDVKVALTGVQKWIAEIIDRLPESE